MVEQNAVAGKQIVCFTVIHGCEIREHLSASIRRAWMKGRRFGLRCLNNSAKHFRRRGLVKLWRDADFPDCFQNSDRAESRNVAGVFRRVEAYPNVRLRAEVVDLVGNDLTQDRVERARIAQVSVQQKET